MSHQVSTQALLGRMKTLPSLPSSLVELYTVVRRETSGAGELERVIKPDPALTANLLRIANSAYFGCPRQVTSIRQAITMMGTNRVLDVASSAGFAQVIPPHLPGYGLESTAFWVHCSAVAMLGDQLARRSGLAPPELIFTAGLLHDIGKLAIGVFLSRAEDDVQTAMTGQKLAMVEAERAVLGTDHAEVGAALADHWKLPKVVGEVCRFHHAPEGSPAEHQRLVDLVHVANSLAHSLGYGADTGGLARRADHSASERLGITVRQLEQLACDTMEPIANMAALLTRKGN